MKDVSCGRQAAPNNATRQLFRARFPIMQGVERSYSKQGILYTNLKLSDDGLLTVSVIHAPVSGLVYDFVN